MLVDLPELGTRRHMHGHLHLAAVGLNEPPVVLADTPAKLAAHANPLTPSTF